MRIITTLLVLLFSFSAWAIEIADLPEEIADSYDISCKISVTALPKNPITMTVETGYTLRISSDTAELLKSGVTVGKSPITFKFGDNDISVKRRPGTVALLINHRTSFYAPMPDKPQGSVAIGAIPSGITFLSARYYDIAAPVFGDDFMRPDILNRTTTSGAWIEDDQWKVGFYKKENPGSSPTDPKTNMAMANPWMLSLYPVVDTTTNAFWFVYRGVGPSWAIVRDNLAYPTWDSYYVETAVRPEFDSMVGLIAGFQDNKNYLLFRWKQRNYSNDNKISGVSFSGKCELVAVTDGTEKVIASGTRGFDPNQWYKIRINLGLKKVQALIDNQIVLEALNTAPAEGGIGLFANGSESPRRIAIDDVTADMYKVKDETTGKIVNDAADAMRKSSVVFFDDVKVGEWIEVPDALTDSPYKIDTTGKWTIANGTAKLSGMGKLLTGPEKSTDYEQNILAKISNSQSASTTILFNITNADAMTGYAWTLTAKNQKLSLLEKGKNTGDVAISATGITPGEWQSLKVDVNGAYIALYVNGIRTIEYYSKEHTAGRCGIMSMTTGVEVKSFSISKLPPPPYNTVDIHAGFEKDRWLATWSSPEADWYPVDIPKVLVTPQGFSHAGAGAAAPLPTDVPGLYWYKGSIYHDFKVKIPISATSVDGQTIYLSPGQDTKNGYAIDLAKSEGGGTATLTKKGEKVCDGKFTYGDLSQLVLYRQGSYFILLAQKLDKEDTSKEQDVKEEEVVFAWKDIAPMQAEKFGFKVTLKELPAAQIAVQSDRTMDTFDTAPSGWVTESGIWLVMARYSCQPKWNWFGGFGKGTPTVWTKNRLDGDQNFEAYMGIKMQYDNAPEEYKSRYRDLNITICADGSHLNSGYSVIRNGKPLGTPVTMLVRKGVIVKTTTAIEHLLPVQNTGHRQWFATRIEKRNIETIENGKKSVKAEINVFLDNKLAMTYIDDDPITGGYAAVWTLDNGLMLGRANYSAEKITVGSPRAAAPLAIMDDIKSLPVPTLTVNTIPIQISTFEKDNDGWKEKPGISARILREKSPNINNVYLKLINSFPAGDFSVNAPVTGVNLNNTPILSFDYCFDSGTTVNLYARRGVTWYEIILCGKPGQDKNIFTATVSKVLADGAWHHTQLDIKSILIDAITKQTGVKPVDVGVDELVLADWGASPEIRPYGFGYNPGGKVMRIDNFCFLPVMGNTATIAWTLPAGITKVLTSIDDYLLSPGITPATGSISVPARKTQSFVHLQSMNDKNEPQGLVTLPAPVTP